MLLYPAVPSHDRLEEKYSLETNVAPEGNRASDQHLALVQLGSSDHLTSVGPKMCSAGSKDISGGCDLARDNSLSLSFSSSGRACTDLEICMHLTKSLCVTSPMGGLILHGLAVQ